MNFRCLIIYFYGIVLGSGSTSEKTSESVALVGSASEITVEKSVEFSYEELAKATNDFNYSCKIGQGGFGSVYYAELRGEVRCIISKQSCDFLV